MHDYPVQSAYDLSFPRGKRSQCPWKNLIPRPLIQMPKLGEDLLGLLYRPSADLLRYEHSFLTLGCGQHPIHTRGKPRDHDTIMWALDSGNVLIPSHPNMNCSRPIEQTSNVRKLPGRLGGSESPA
jgi:hypothetical protein